MMPIYTTVITTDIAGLPVTNMSTGIHAIALQDHGVLDFHTATATIPIMTGLGTATASIHGILTIITVGTHPIDGTDIQLMVTAGDRPSDPTIMWFITTTM